MPIERNLGPIARDNQDLAPQRAEIPSSPRNRSDVHWENTTPEHSPAQPPTVSANTRSYRPIPAGRTRDVEEQLISALSSEWNGHNYTPDFRFQAENGVWYWGYIPEAWIGKAPTEWSGPALVVEPVVPMETFEGPPMPLPTPACLMRANPSERSDLSRATSLYYRDNPDKRTSLPQTSIELLIRALSNEDVSTQIAEFKQLSDQYDSLVQHERSSREKEARWRYLQRSAKEFLEHFVGELRNANPSLTEDQIRAIYQETPTPLLEFEIEQNTPDATDVVGPCTYTVEQLATLVGMTGSGVCKLLREEKKIRGVRVKFLRNGGKRAAYQIADSSFLAIQRRLNRTD